MKNLINHWAKLIAESNEEEFKEVEDTETVDQEELEDKEPEDESGVYEIYKQVYDNSGNHQEKMMSEEEFNKMLSEMTNQDKTQYISELKKIAPLVKTHKATKTIDDKIFDSSKAFDSAETFDIHQKAEVLVRPDVDKEKVFVNFVIRDGGKNLDKRGYRLCKDIKDAKKWVSSEIRKLKDEGLDATDFKVINKETETIQNKYDRKNPNNQIPDDQIQKLPDTIEKIDPNALMLQYKDLTKGIGNAKAYTFVIYTAKKAVALESFERNLADAMEHRNKEDDDSEVIDKILEVSGLSDDDITKFKKLLKSKNRSSKEDEIEELFKKSTLDYDDLTLLYKLTKSEYDKNSEISDQKKKEKEDSKTAGKSTSRNVDKDDLAVNQPYKSPIDFSDIGIEPDETNDITDKEIEDAAHQDQTLFNTDDKKDYDSEVSDDGDDKNDDENSNDDNDEENRNYDSNYGDIDNDENDNYEDDEDGEPTDPNKLKSSKKEPEDYDMTPELKDQIKQYVKELTMGDIDFEEVPDEVKYDGFGDLRPQFKKFSGRDSYDHYNRFN